MTHPFPPSLGPIAPERNPTPHPEWYKPSRFVISDISIGLTTLITTAIPHNYVIGQLIRVLVPFYYGTYQISGQEGYVMSIPSPTQVLVDINSVGYNAYIPTPAYTKNSPQIMAIGDVNTGQQIETGRFTPLRKLTIPGAFQNISPTNT